MADATGVKQIKQEAAEYGTHLITVVIHVLFLCLWGAVNIVPQHVFKLLRLDDVEALIFRVIQVLFAIATLAPLCFFLYRDIMIMKIKAARAIADAENGKA